MQYIGVAFPASVGTVDLLFDQGATPKFSCALTDGTNSYNVLAVQPVASSIVTTIPVESNIAYCRLMDTSVNVPLKTGTGIVYTLNLTLNAGTKISSNLLRQISLFTSTANHPEKMIIDIIPVLGNVVLYADVSALSPKALSIESTAVTVTSGPSSLNAGTIVYPYNTFDVRLNLKANNFISAADNVVVIYYNNQVVSPPTSVSSVSTSATDPLQVAVKGSLLLKTYDTSSFYVSGIAEDLIPNRQFALNLKGWQALDTAIGTSGNISLVVYYKNTNSMLSNSIKSIFLVTADVTTVTANHPESWDVYRGGAWPIAFTFTTANDLVNGGWVLIQSAVVAQTATAGSTLSFIASTCDFSNNNSGFDQSFGKRANCYPISHESGSGIFFHMTQPIKGGQAYSVTVWAFFEICGGTGNDAFDVVNSSTSYTSPTFTVTINTTINPSSMDATRFSNVLSQSVAQPFDGKCFNNAVFQSDAAPGESWSTTTQDLNTITQATGTNLRGMLNYREIYSWVTFSEIKDQESLSSGVWYKALTSSLAASTSNFIYSATSANTLSTSSYFLAALDTLGTRSNDLYKKIAIPTLSNTASHPPGRWYWQFPAKWFTAGNGYKTGAASTCYASWSIASHFKMTGTPASANYVAASSNYAPQSANYAAASANYVAASANYAAASANYAAATAGTAQVGTAQVGTAQVGTAQVGTPLIGTAQVGTAQVGTAQVGVAGDPNFAYASADYVAASPNYVAASANYAPQSANYAAASPNYAAASANYVAASANYAAASPNYAAASANYAAASANYAAASANYAAATAATAQVGTAQVGTAQVGTAQVGTPRIGTAQVGTAASANYAATADYTDMTGSHLLQELKVSTTQFEYKSGYKNFFGASTYTSSISTGSTLDATRTLLPPDNINTTLRGNILRVVSEYHNGYDSTSAAAAVPAATFSSWKVMDYTLQNRSVYSYNPINVAFFTSCVKWVSAPPKLTSMYTYIDVQIKWNYLARNATGEGATISNMRLIKLFPETGVFNDFAKNPTGATALASNPMLNHVIYNAYGHDSVCLLELSGASIAKVKDTISNTLAIWIFGGILLETDYSDASSTYPVAPLVSGVQAYGLQSGYVMDFNNNPWFVPSVPVHKATDPVSTPILYQLGINNTILPLSNATGIAYAAAEVDGLVAEQLVIDTSQQIDWAGDSTYMWFMGSVVYLTSVTTTSLTATTEQNFFIPYYCPRWIANMQVPKGQNPSIYKAHVFPVVMAAWVNAGAHNIINSVGNWVTYLETSPTNNSNDGYVKVLTNPFNVSSYVAKTNAITESATVLDATLKFSPYTTDNNYLYVYNGIVTQANTGVICTGHSLFLHSSISLTTPVSYVGFTGGASGVFTGTKLFYVLGRPFTQAVFTGLGGSPATPSTIPTATNMAGLIADGSVASANYFRGITRPTVDAFVNNGVLSLTDRVAYFCTAINTNLNIALNNLDFSADGTTSFFVLDWYKDMSNTALWANGSLSYDKTDVYKGDYAANFKVVLSPPKPIPAGAQVMFSTNDANIQANTICGLIVTVGGLVTPCLNASNSITCTVPVGGSSFTVCCYNVYVSLDTVSLKGIAASFPADSTVDGVGPYLTSTIYNANFQTGVALTNPFSFTSSNTSATVVSSASITAVTFSQTKQEAGIGKVTFTVTLPREATRDMKLTVSGDMKALLIPGNTPRCQATFGSNSVYGSNWDNGDALIDTCSSSNLASTINTLVVTTKAIVYKCGVIFAKTIYISLWPVININWADPAVSKSFKAVMTLKSTGTDIALNNVVFNMPSTPLVTAKPAFPGQWDTLCAVSSVTPKIPGERAEIVFDFDLDTNKAVIATALPNEVTIFFPYYYFGATIGDVMCTLLGAMVNCNFTDEGILNIRFSTALTVGSGKKISVSVHGVLVPAFDGDYSFPCTINTTDFTTGTRTNLLTGSGKIAGGANLSLVTSMGVLKFLQTPNPVSDSDPRDVSQHDFRITFDNASNITPSPVTIANTPVIYVQFPNQYNLAWFTNKPSASIDEYTSDVNNLITKTSTIVPANVVVSGNRIAITLTQASYTFGTNWRYWDIKITNIMNPMNTTVNTVNQTTRRFHVMLTNTNLTSLYRTYTSNDSYASTALTTGILAFNKGNSFVFDNTKWVVDVYSTSTQLNILTVKAGRYLSANFSIRANPSITNPNTVTLSLTDPIFKTDKASYISSTAGNSPTTFWIGCTCGTTPGKYLVNFTSSDSTNFFPLSPVVVSVDSYTKSIISFQTPANVPIGGSTFIYYTLSDVNFDALSFKWAAPTGTTNDATAIFSDGIFPAGNTNPIYSTFSITTATAPLAAQTFLTTDPSNCYTFNSVSTISFTVSGAMPALPTTNLASYFKYSNADTDATITIKNSIKFVFTPTVAPIYLYCALACINSALPADATVISPPLGASNNLLQFYSGIVLNTTPVAISFANLVRGQQYHLKCVMTSTNGNPTLRNSTSVSIENYTPATVNSTVVNFIPSPPQATQCIAFNFDSEPGTVVRIAIANYCQSLYSASGWSTNGCIICTNPDTNYMSPGLSLPTNITCPTTTASSRLRFLQTTNTTNTTVTPTTNTTTTNTTVSTLISYNLCPVAHPICATDVTTTKSFRMLASTTASQAYSAIVSQIMNSLKTPALFKTTLNLSNVPLNALNAVAIVSDSVAPDATKFSPSVVSSNINGAASWLASYATKIQCFWMIADASVVTTTPVYTVLEGCTDPSWCGTSMVGPGVTSLSTTSMKPFTAGSTYNIFMECKNNIPGATMRSTVVSAGTFTIPAAVVAPTNSTVTPVVTSSAAAGYISFSMTLMFLFALLF